MNWFERIRLCLEGGVIGYMVGALFGEHGWYSAIVGMIVLAALQFTHIFDRPEHGEAK